ncbi:hypothetical protein K501DRAFT_314442 [Backusella circina FSU 941]|nr:hypothetical protein K501DRAFT_314442 [Backusella circina FSU 941]
MKSLYLIVLGLLSVIHAQNIDYNVITMLNSSEIMTVIVDNQTYPLTSHSDIPILFTGSAPIATHTGYRYAKINRDGNTSTIESFMRPPVNSSTPNEFFSRSWNQRSVAPLPVLYQPIKPIDRVKSDLHIDGQIPTFHIQGNQTEFDAMHHNTTQDLHLKSNVTYISLKDTLFFDNVEVSLAGRSSLMFPKLSYNLKLDKNDDLYHYRRIKLRALASDPSYIREQIAYDSIQSVGLASSGFSFCRLFLNNQELGLFGVMETFQDPWLANEFNNGKTYKDGRLYQGVTGNETSLKQGLVSDLSYIDNNVTAYAQGQYKIKEEGSKKDDYAPLMDITQFLNVDAPMNGTDVIEEWNKKWNTESFLRSMALEVLIGFSDGYLAMADNYYVYQLPKSDQFFYLPSDMDMTYGNTMFTLDKMWSGNYSTYPGLQRRPIMTRMLQIPEFNSRYEELLVDFTNNLVNPTVMHDRIYDLYNMLQEDVAWDKTLPRVGIAEELPTLNSSSESAIASALKSNQNFSHINITTYLDFLTRSIEDISFETAINGPTGHASLAGIKEWLYHSHQNTDTFFNSTPVDL